MDALWEFEDKLKFTTGKASLLLAFLTFALVGVCTLIVLRRKARKNKIAHQATSDEIETRPAGWPEMTPDIRPNCGWMSVKRVLTRSMRWCRARKWEENSIEQKKERWRSLGMGWQSHNSVSPVWQRPILRGEKCELPRFSGLILYDEEGRLLPESESEINSMETSNQVIN